MRVCAKKRFFLKLIFSILIMPPTQGMVENIKNTHQIVRDDYKHLSLIHGCVAWETGFIRRLYDFGQIFPVFTDYGGRQVITDYEKLDQTHMTVLLTHALFYRVPRSNSDADFGITKQLGVSDVAKIAQTIAKILALLERLKNQLPAFGDAIEFLASQLSLWKSQQNLVLIYPLSQPKSGKFLIDTAAESCRKISSKGADKQVRDMHAEVLTQISATLKTLAKLLHYNPKNQTGLLKPAARQSGDMAQVLLNSLRECGNNKLYMPHTTQTILLAFVYKACGHDRSALAHFYATLDEELNGSLLKLNTMLDKAWQHDIFGHITQDQATETIKKILVDDQMQAQKNLDANFEYFVYCQQQVKAYPSLIIQSDAIFKTPSGVAKFHNCMENAIHNFFNILAYNQETNCFQLSQLKKRMNFTGDFHPDLEAFYDKYNTQIKAESTDGRNAWGQLVSNIKHVPYIQTFEDQEYLYELRASIKTIILVLNHLLNLNLFNNNLNQEVNRKDFIAHYFPMLCITLGAKDQYFSKIEKASTGNVKLMQNIDAHDLIDQIYSTMIFKDEHNNDLICEFFTRKGHGEFKIYNNNQNKNTTELCELINLHAQYNSSNGMMSLINSSWLNTLVIDFEHLKNVPTFIYNNLFAMPLDNVELSEVFLMRLEEQRNQTETSTTTTAFRKLLLKLAARHISPDKQLLLQLTTFVNFFDTLSGDECNQAIVIAEKGMVFSCLYQRLSLKLFELLIKNGMGLSEAKNFIRPKDPNNETFIESGKLKLLQILIQNNHGLEPRLASIQVEKIETFTDQHNSFLFFKNHPVMAIIATALAGSVYYFLANTLVV